MLALSLFLSWFVCGLFLRRPPVLVVCCPSVGFLRVSLLLCGSFGFLCGFCLVSLSGSCFCLSFSVSFFPVCSELFPVLVCQHTTESSILQSDCFARRCLSAALVVGRWLGVVVSGVRRPVLSSVRPTGGCGPACFACYSETVSGIVLHSNIAHLTCL